MAAPFKIGASKPFLDPHEHEPELKARRGPRRVPLARSANAPAYSARPLSASGSNRLQHFLQMVKGVVAAGVLLALLSARVATAADARVDVRHVQSLPCTRAGIAEAVMAFTALLNEKRFDATRLIWLPKRRVPTPGFFWMAGTGRYLRAQRGREIPETTRRWLGRGGTSIEVIMINPRINRSEPARAAFAVEWVRPDEADGSLLRGAAKGGWDCEKRRISMFGGGERSVDTVETARAEAAGRCGRGYRTFRRHGQTAYLCRLPRGATS